MKKKIGIFTSLMMSPPHPRIVMEKELLEKNNFEPEIIFSKKRKNEAKWIHQLFYYLTFTYFRWDLISIYKKRIADFDTVIIYDLSLLPLARTAKQKGKQVVYETIDNNVHLVFYELQKIFSGFALLKSPVTEMIQRMEKRFTKKYTDRIIVNSEALANEFPKDKTLINYYSSPFEGVTLEKNADKTAFLYLGIFSPEKGANEMLALSSKYAVPFYVFGEIRNVEEEKVASSGIIHTPRISIEELLKRIKEISEKFRLVGISIVMPVNKSYATQEANKEMDYLALGIPFAGNYRSVTKSKIEAGCGVFFDNEKGIQQLLSDKAFYNSLAQNALRYYTANYSKERFEKILLSAIAEHTRQ